MSLKKTQKRPDSSLKVILLKIFTAIFGRIPFISTRARANAARFLYRKEKIVLSGIPKELHGVELLFLTDPHIGGNIDEHVQEIKKNMEKLIADSDPAQTFVLHGGDFICGEWNDLSKSENNAFDIADILFDGLEKYHNFGVVGNHDADDVNFLRMQEDLRKKIGLEFLTEPGHSKSFETNGKKIGVHGIHTLVLHLHTMPKEEREELMDRYITNLNKVKNDINIVLLHSPDGLEFLLARLVETSQKIEVPTLFFAGHTHGAMFDVTLLRTLGLHVCKTSFSRYKGWYGPEGKYAETGNWKMYVGTGMGNSPGFDFRFNADPEVVLFTL